MRIQATRGSLSGYLAALALTLICVALLRSVPAITARAAVPVLLLAVLVSARTWGTGSALLASAAATVGYTAYFLPIAPLGTDEQWVALVNFTVSAVVVGELAARAERRHQEAQEGRREIERLYKQLETAFERASEAEAKRRSDEVKAALLDALTHNLRTPLTSIKASVTALLGSGNWNEAAGLSPAERRELLEVIDEESDRLNRFVQGLSTAAKPPTEHFDQRAVSAGSIVSAAVSRAEALTREHHIVMKIEPSLPPLAVDEAAVVEVVYMLLDNATKYSPAGSEIQLNASQEGAAHALIEVVDEGPGIPVALRERVFENFFRIEGREPEDPKRRGIGLGLPIARRLVEAQEGRIWIETPSSRRGTAVIMMLPLTVEASRGDSAPTAAAAS